MGRKDRGGPRRLGTWEVGRMGIFRQAQGSRRGQQGRILGTMKKLLPTYHIHFCLILANTGQHERRGASRALRTIPRPSMMFGSHQATPLRPKGV